MAEICSAFFLPPWLVVPGPFREGASLVPALALGGSLFSELAAGGTGGGLESLRARPTDFLTHVESPKVTRLQIVKMASINFLSFASG